MTTGDMRQMWATNVVPIVAAAREGASHANRVARKEWARTHRRTRLHHRTRSWRRWMLVAGGVALVGTAGGIAAAMAQRRSGTNVDLAMTRDEAKAGLQSTMEAGRERAGASRDAARKLHRDNPGRSASE